MGFGVDVAEAGADIVCIAPVPGEGSVPAGEGCVPATTALRLESVRFCTFVVKKKTPTWNKLPGNRSVLVLRVMSWLFYSPTSAWSGFLLFPSSSGRGCWWCWLWSVASAPARSRCVSGWGM